MAPLKDRIEGLRAEFEKAAAAAKDMPADFRVSITNPAGEDAYPIASFTWLLVYKEQRDESKGRSLVKFLHWAIHDGQRFGPPLHYAPLPQSLVPTIEAKLREIRHDGQALVPLGR